jgi:hypothetical protein
MTTLTLTFQGPGHQARAALGSLLQRFRNAQFVERTSTQFAVTADDDTAKQLTQLPDWAAAPDR